MTTLIAAFIGAAAALAVMVIDRAWSAREQRRAERRRIYAEFLGACSEAMIGDLPVDERMLNRMAALEVRLTEVLLVGPPDVRRAAFRLAQLVSEEMGDQIATAIKKTANEPADETAAPSSLDVSESTSDFLKKARRDVGVRR